jgi:hypothetical protein
MPGPRRPGSRCRGPSNVTEHDPSPSMITELLRAVLPGPYHVTDCTKSILVIDFTRAGANRARAFTVTYDRLAGPRTRIKIMAVAA